jgi:hypothetical protein
MQKIIKLLIMKQKILFMVLHSSTLASIENEMVKYTDDVIDIYIWEI